jgi:hypothetical protein
VDLEGDSFGKIYEYFLSEFAAAEGSMGGEFYTPTSIVRLLVEVLEPFRGRILDPACRSGGSEDGSEHHLKRGGLIGLGNEGEAANRVFAPQVPRGSHAEPYRHISSSEIPASFKRCRRRPVLSDWLAWMGTDSLTSESGFM